MIVYETSSIVGAVDNVFCCAQHWKSVYRFNKRELQSGELVGAAEPASKQALEKDELDRNFDLPTEEQRLSKLPPFLLPKTRGMQLAGGLVSLGSRVLRLATT